MKTRAQRLEEKMAAIQAKLSATLERRETRTPAHCPPELRPQNYFRIEGVSGIWFGPVPEALANRNRRRLETF